MSHSSSKKDIKQLTRSIPEASLSTTHVRRRPVYNTENKMVPKAHLLDSDSDSEGNSVCQNLGHQFSHSVQTKHDAFHKLSALTPLNSNNKDGYDTSNFMGQETINVNGYAPPLTDMTSQDEEDVMYVQIHSSEKSSKTMHKIRHEFGSESCDNEDPETDDDKKSLLPNDHSKKAKFSDIHISGLNAVDTANKNVESFEGVWTIGLQTLFPFLMAGLGMVAAGVVLDQVQHWEVFVKVPEIFILVPALLGLKGNLEMTLASRLSTYANRGYLDEPSKRWKIIWGNMLLVEAQAMVVAFLASLVAMTLGWIPDGKWETNHAIILCTGSLLTGAIASALLGMVMILVIMSSKRLGINPDNVATPIAAALGDLITLTLLSAIAKGLYFVLYTPKYFWIGPGIIILFAILTPLVLWLAHRNEFTRDVVKHGWTPVIAAMGISSTGGFILDFAVSQNPGIAVFSPVINGVGGNLVAVQASRISTYLHTSGHPLGSLPEADKPGCISPWKTYLSSGNRHSVGARVLLAMVVPGQLIFVLIIQALKAGHTSITPQFVVVYIFVSVVQVAILLQVCNCLVLRLWKNGDDPDNSAIPYLTALGDLLGTGLLAAGFLFLWLVGDRDMDVGD
ncbi:solute carrier family 41 member 1-like [Clavelina lepadiformis]|uniref:solute carrier family 41 member 1-like n=1 Tax=Clavelina lepadiformis TaxID=159417 RepID=UPI004041BF2A